MRTSRCRPLRFMRTRPAMRGQREAVRSRLACLKRPANRTKGGHTGTDANDPTRTFGHINAARVFTLGQYCDEDQLDVC